MSRTSFGSKIVYQSDVVGAPPVGAALTTSKFSTEHLASMDCANKNARRDEKQKGYGATYIRALTVLTNWIVPHVRMFPTVFMHWRLGEIVNYFEEHIFMLFPERKPMTFFWLIDEACY